ncbi:hypothetical protein ACU045_12220 [Microbacterium sp. MAHUQ-60]|uniref:hypothetical protein n=1 Tax=unclassified Microbacterium TaxID=2609290 RepID=UPI00361A5EE5
MSTHDVEQCIKSYLRENDGTAPAGDVTAHAVAAGHAASTVRRVADRVVLKQREGNAFTWSLKPAPKFTPPPAPAPATPSRVGHLVDKSKKPSLWDAMLTNGIPMRPDPFPKFADPVAAPVTDERRERLGAPEPESAAPAFESPYARLSQRERLNMIERRPTVAHYAAPSFTELTEMETITILEGDDDGLYTLDHTAGGSSPLPY